MPRAARSLLIVALVVAGCGLGGPTAGPSSPPVTATPATAATDEPLPTIGPPPSPTPDDGTSPLTIDATLLDRLPAQVGGVDVVEDLGEATLALSNADLQQVGSAIDAAVAVDTGSGNLVYALVVALRPGALGEAGFRDWRDSYDEGACADAGLVIGHGEAEIDGRTVHIGTCEGGIRTYHVLLDEGAILISSWSLGDGGFGEELVSNLREQE